ncbi:MAG: F0F1 ATP synthase subunit B [Candidatus Saganbacteria bacterium]|nr:F0F1 ATP synthase subunit B [Candidatus Saganbacteria bacterium]
MLEFEPGLFIWTVVSFGLLVVLLYRVALPPLLGFLAERERLIAGQLAEAAAGQKQAEQLVAEHKRELAEVHRRAEEIVAKARDEGRAARDEILARASGEADRVLARAQLDLERERTEIMTRARTEIVDLVAAAAGKVIRRKLSAAEDRALIERSLTESRG